MQSFATKPLFFVIAKAMGCLLRHAGVKVSDSEVKREIDASIMRAANAGVDEADAKEVFAVQAMQQLVAVLFDGASAGDGEAPGETSAS